MKGKHGKKIHHGKSYSMPGGGKDKMANKTVRTPANTKSDLPGLASGYNAPKEYEGGVDGHNCSGCD